MGFHEKVEKDQIAPGDLDMAQEWILRVHSLMEEASDTRGASNVVLFIDPITNTEKVSHVELLHVRGRHPLHHAIMTGIEDVALAERQDRLAKHTTVQYDQDSGERTKKRDLCFADDENRGKLGYLCSGMDVYVYREPCIMCAMALVHSRIRRLFFIKKKGSWGGLTRKEYAIHTHKSLNHKFKVWQAVFKEK